MPYLKHLFDYCMLRRMAGGGRPRDDQPVLRVPMAEQRDYFLDEARALLAYIESGGAVARLAVPSGDDHAVVAFALEREAFWQLTAELRQSRRDTERRR